MGKLHKIEQSTLWTVIGIVFLFSFAIVITLSAPRHIDPTWTQPTSPYQVQMYEIQDPNLYLSSTSTEGRTLEYVDHLKQNFSLLAFMESDTVRIVAPPELEKFVTKVDDTTLKLTSRLLLLRDLSEATPRDDYDPQALAKQLRPPEDNEFRIAYTLYELYDPQQDDAFARSFHDGILANWVDRQFTILDDTPHHPYHTNMGVIYVKNPIEFRYTQSHFGDAVSWRYSPTGKPVTSVDELLAEPLSFHSRQELIANGEHIYAIEGCWYCHTDQARTLVQDLVLDGSPEFPAPPSSPNEYIYQKITFPGTRRIGPDMARVAIKRPSRDWHMSHFWSPKSESPGSIMPSFKHFFAKDPRGAMKTVPGIPNYQFESIFQYLMTKGSRITPPTEAWWEGKDPVHTLEIIQGEAE